MLQQGTGQGHVLHDGHTFPFGNLNHALGHGPLRLEGDNGQRRFFFVIEQPDGHVFGIGDHHRGAFHVVGLLAVDDFAEELFALALDMRVAFGFLEFLLDFLLGHHQVLDIFSPAEKQVNHSNGDKHQQRIDHDVADHPARYGQYAAELAIEQAEQGRDIGLDCDNQDQPQQQDLDD